MNSDLRELQTLNHKCHFFSLAKGFLKRSFHFQKLLPATHEDQIQAELIQMKEELDKTSHELIELRKTKAEQLQIIDDLKVG